MQSTMGRNLGLIFFACFHLVSGMRFLNPSPQPKNPGEKRMLFTAKDINVRSKDNLYGFPWERSGLFEGDIMMPPGDLKNIVSSPTKRWSMPIPVFINGSDFDREELTTIQKALTELEEMTCVRFRQYKEKDESFIVVRGHDKGCWSMVGRRDAGQVVHLQRPACVQHGIVVHEFLHALGLYHQQSSPDRDNFVNILWSNIKPGREHNFNKYSSPEVTTYDLQYDYQSIMHYSEKAFSVNGEPTITPKKNGAKIGQRSGLSELDAKKVRMMYDCPDTPMPVKKPDKEEEDFDWDLEKLVENFSKGVSLKG